MFSSEIHVNQEHFISDVSKILLHFFLEISSLVFVRGTSVTVELENLHITFVQYRSAGHNLSRLSNMGDLETFPAPLLQPPPA